MGRRKILKNEYISLKEASKISGYNPDYLGCLIRSKKLGGVMVGRDWFTTKEALKAYLSFQKFLPVEKISPEDALLTGLVQQKSRLKLVFVIFLVLISIGLSFFIFGSNFGVFSQSQAGDFVNKIKLKTEKVLIGGEGSETIQEFQEFDVTSYSADKSGDIEISVQPKPNK